ncbi:alginate export family protein [Sphingomonas sp.]|uniref:alginate export family protein n=1 Tax=Sphingomonas sp. TaxID=28214 RepID=UPI002BE617E5|nr:alginate export family protein [Sphingomonas sp.]HTG39930.1 alginate export family protein [Sphingomonas sp.]
MNCRRATSLSITASALALLAASPAAAQQTHGAIPVGNGLSIDPIIDARLRYEGVDQPVLEADAVTLRLRAGAELRHAPSNLSLLAEAEGTLAVSEDYNAFPFPLTTSGQYRPGFSTVADPESIELNRLQIQYRTRSLTLTAGRQRINLDDQRFVGSVGWRQNEQTFDAVRAESVIGPITVDATYAIGQNPVFGSEAGPRRHVDGNFAFLNAGAKLGPIGIKAFGYLLDFDENWAFSNSSQTYGARAGGAIPLTPAIKLNLLASYARQSDLGGNPRDYTADYVLAEAGLGYAGFTLTGGYEKLGADADGGAAFQTPLATLHKFNGWADLFLTTPATGLQDGYVTLAKAFPGVAALPGLNANVTHHRFHSDIGGIEYGDEWDASVGFRVGQVAMLAKYADYHARSFGADKQIVWLQAELAL